MKYICDEEQGIIGWLIKIPKTEWYIQINEDYPYYIKLNKDKSKIEKATRDLPYSVNALMI
jgi:exosome complex RNA-binding protein Rrp4